MVTAVLLAIFGSLVAALLRGEVDGWSPRIAASIVKKAVQLMAPDKRARYGEEWMAHLDDLPTPLSKLLASFGILVAAERIRSTPRERLVFVLDKICAIITLAILAPLMCVVSFLLSRETGRPAIFKKTFRIGERDVTCYRFVTVRSPVTDLTKVDRGPIGHFVRNTSLQDLPMLWTVLRGDITLFGPKVIWTAIFTQDCPDAVGRLSFLGRPRDVARDMISVFASLFRRG